jgi:sirohydrochlorin cobaltochelatase
MRSYPRTAANDPFYFNSQEMAQQLATETGLETLFCFNEFCNPSLTDAVATAVEHNVHHIIVLTPMMTRGGGHAEEDIPTELETLRKIHPEVEFQYAWPFDPAKVTRFLAGQVHHFA